jgi:superfamily II DNA or RNA helicase
VSQLAAATGDPPAAWPAWPAGSATVTGPPQPAAHQERALADVIAGLGRPAGRGQLLQACGTGKTLLGRWAAHQLDADLVLVVVPTLALIGQTLAEWRRPTGWPFTPLVVCSDPSTAAGVAERGDDGAANRLGSTPVRGIVPVTTNPVRVATFLERTRPGRARVVFSTYHSVPVVGDGARLARPRVRFDLVVLDEAHHLAGRSRRAFRAVLDDQRVPAARRLFMTATPVVVQAPDDDDDDLLFPDRRPVALSMDDPAVFGPVLHRLPFGQAINEGLLTDYEVLVVAEGSQGPPRADADELLDEQTALGALRQAATQHGLRRVLSFHGRVAKARRFAAALDGTRLADGRRIHATYVAGTMPAAARRAALRRLEAARPGELVVVANARCLAEGVDVPAVDAVLFADPRRSVVDTVQAVGRVLRPAAGKPLGVVIVPLTLPADLDDDSALLASRWAHVWTVLRALRAHDERLAAEIDAALRATARTGRPPNAGAGTNRIRFLLPDRVSPANVSLRLVEAVGAGWERYFGLLERYVTEHGNARVPRAYRTAPDDLPLGLWAERQQIAHRRRLLPADRAARLAALRGWVWDAAGARWHANLAALRGLATRWAAEEPGQDLPTWAARRDPLPAAQRRVLVWAAAQRVAWRAEELADWQIAALEATPGWRWTAIADPDVAMVDALREYVIWEHDANVPGEHVEDGRPLGRWLTEIRWRRAAGRLPAALADEIAAVTPPPQHRGALRWNHRESLWSLGLAALQAFGRREGHARVPHDHLERLPELDLEVQLGHWTVVQRQGYRHGRLDPARAALLERQPGWRWEVQPAERVAVELGSIAHGTREGYQKGCHRPCCAAALIEAEQRRRQRRAAGLPATDLVDAARARHHVRALAAQGASQRSMARAAEVNVKTVTELLDDTLQRVWPETEQRVLALTIEQVRAAAVPGTRVDAGPTWRLLDDLAGRGWPKRWIARELGGTGQALQLSRREVTAETAAKVTALHERIGDRQPPPRRWRAPLPTLAALEAGADNAPLPAAACNGDRRGEAETGRPSTPPHPAAPITMVHVAPARARARLGKLEQLGVSRLALARAADVPLLRVRGILEGHTERLVADEAARILALSTGRAAEITARAAQAPPPTAWEQRYELLVAWARLHGHANPPGSVAVDGVWLGRWVCQQRALHWHGRLSTERAALLAALPGSSWAARPPRAPAQGREPLAGTSISDRQGRRPQEAKERRCRSM